MESLLISLISVALVIVATVTMTISTFGSTVKLTDSLLKMEQQSNAIRHTSITVTPPANYSGGNVNLMVANDGQTNLSDFENWDLMVEYQSGNTQYLNYTTNSTLSANEWTVYGIFMSSNTSMPEAFDYNILNPWETANLTVDLSPQIASGQSGRFTVSTPNGVTAQCILTRP